MSTEVEGYKEVQLGPKRVKIPDIWDYSDLGSQCEIYQPETITEKNMIEDGRYKVFGANGIIGSYSQYNHKTPQVLVTCRGATCGTVNFSEEKSWITGNAMVVKPNKCPRISKYFLRYYLEKSNLSRTITGSAQPQITKNSLSVFQVLLPPKVEQKKIAEVLSTVDSAIQKTEEIIEQAKELKKGLMQDLLTKGIGHDEFKDVQLGPKQLEIPQNWKIQRIKQIGEIVTGTTPSTDEKKNFGRAYPFVTPEDMGDIKNIESANRGLSHRGIERARKLPKNAVMYACIGATIGKIALAGTTLATNQQINSIVCSDSYNPNYVYYSLQLVTPLIKSQAGNTATPIVNKGEFSKFSILVPPLSEQKKIAKILSAVDEKIQKEKDYKEKLEELKKGLMQDLLTGKVRVLSLLSDEEKEELKEADVTG